MRRRRGGSSDRIVGERRLSRVLLAAAVLGPALAIGGVSPWTVPPFALVVAVMLAVQIRRGRPLAVPTIGCIGAVAVGFTLVQVVPLPGVRGLLSPLFEEWITRASAGLSGPRWDGLSVVPADTAVEAVRLAALVGLAVVAARHTWRWSAAVVAITGTVVATLGLLQYGLGIDRIYGLYAAKHGARELSSALLTTFVSPNHQSGLLLLSLLSTAGLLVDGRGLPYGARRFDRRVALGAALLIQLAALVLSMSRAALLVAAVVAPLAAAVAWWPEARPRSSRWSRVGPRLASTVLVLGIAIGLGTQGAGAELATLLAGDELDPATAARVRVTLASVDLVGLAPLTGIGRGAYGDVFTAFDPAPTHVWYSHLECAPLALVVEWGVVVGGGLALALVAWWISAVRWSGTKDDARARRVVLLGLLAVALQGLADFSLEFLGVAAPAAALAGALSPVTKRSLNVFALRRAALTLAGMALACTVLVPSTWASRGEPPGELRAPLSLRPLDASGHRRAARDAASVGDWSTALVRARTAVRLSPGQVDGWLLLAAAAHQTGDDIAMVHATGEALERLYAPPDRALLLYLVQAFPEPEALAGMTPGNPWAVRLLVRGLLDLSAAHAESIAAVWCRREPRQAEALQLRTEANLRLGRVALALHLARRWRQLAPADARSHLAVARVLQSSSTPRPDDVRDTLERALVEADIKDAYQRGLIEEQLLRALLRIKGPRARAEARSVAKALRTRPAPPQTRLRWRALFGPVLEG